MNDLSHFDEQGASRMVDTSEKPVSERKALASGRVRMAAETLARIRNVGMAKGNVLEVARLAGIMAAKQTGTLIPLCHPIALDGVTLDFEFLDDETLGLKAAVKCQGRTGVEMEALTAASVAALTIYDMCKSIDRDMTIGEIQLEEKSGGRSGDYLRQ